MSENSTKSSEDSSPDTPTPWPTSPLPKELTDAAAEVRQLLDRAIDEVDASTDSNSSIEGEVETDSPKRIQIYTVYQDDDSEDEINSQHDSEEVEDSEDEEVATVQVRPSSPKISETGISLSRETKISEADNSLTKRTEQQGGAQHISEEPDQIDQQEPNQFEPVKQETPSETKEETEKTVEKVHNSVTFETEDYNELAWKLAVDCNPETTPEGISKK